MSRRLLGGPGSQQAGYREPCLDPERFRETSLDQTGFANSLTGDSQKCCNQVAVFRHCSLLQEGARSALLRSTGSRSELPLANRTYLSRFDLRMLYGSRQGSRTYRFSAPVYIDRGRCATTHPHAHQLFGYNTRTRSTHTHTHTHTHTQIHGIQWESKEIHGIHGFLKS